MYDFKLTADGDMDCSGLDIQLVDGPERVAQQVRTCLRTFLGEYQFDLDAGVPWNQSILAIKGVNLNTVESILRTKILAVDDVLSIVAFVTEFDSQARTMTIHAKINTTFGQIVVEGAFP